MPFPRPEDDDPPLTRRDHAWIAAIAAVAVLGVGVMLLHLVYAILGFITG